MVDVHSESIQRVIPAIAEKLWVIAVQQMATETTSHTG
jgi:hypothetical protein